MPVIDVGQQRTQQFDWLFRGDREALASMGLMHYSMFVYTIHAPRGSSAAPADDFATFRFADTHPDCANRVQKLRVGEMCRVPRLCGFTIPRLDGSEVLFQERFDQVGASASLSHASDAPFGHG